MILRKLTVSSWRSILDPIELGPFDEQINVVHAPNGRGKSSIFEALRRGFFDAHHVTGSEIEEILPWGRNLSPEVKIEIEQAGVRYRIEKKFLQGASARLLRYEDGRFVPLADSKSADAQIRELLGAKDLPGRGLSKQEHWGCYQALWAPQGSLQLNSLSQNVTENLRSALGIQLADKTSSSLDSLLQERYDSYFTKGGKTKSTGKNPPPILAFQEDLERFAEDLRQLTAKQQQFETASRTVEDARNERDQGRRNAEAIGRLVSEARHQAEKYRELQAELKEKALKEENAQAAYDRLDERIQSIRKAREEIINLTSTIESEQTKLQMLTGELEGVRNEFEQARTFRDVARDKELGLDELSAKLDDAKSYLADEKERKQVEAKVKKAESLTSELAVLRNERSGIVSPTDKNIRDLRKFINAREQAEASLKACQIHVTILAKAKLKLQQKDCSAIEIASGKPQTFSNKGRVELDIEGFGTITASGPEGTAAEHEEAIRDAGRKIEKVTQPFGHSDPDMLQELLNRATQSDQQIEGLNDQLEELLEEITLDELKQEFNRLDASLSQRLLKYPAWKDIPPDAKLIQEELESTRKSLRKDIKEAEAAFEAKQGQLTGLERNLHAIEASLKLHQTALKQAKTNLEDITKDGQSDETREAAKRKALMEWEAAKEGASMCSSQLQEYASDPSDEVERLVRQLKAFEDQETAARDRENQAIGSLNNLSADGIYTKLSRCEEQIADLKAKIDLEKVRMDSVRLLYETVSGCKASMVASVLGPIEETASRMLSRIAGSKLGSIQLNEGFVPKGIKPGLAMREVELCNLSGGEQEQLFLVTRLAMGQLLAKGERQLVILDDVLNSTDTGRLTRLLGLMEEAADHLQIVILTCHPERYRAFAKAEFFDLNAVTAKV